MSDLKCRKCGEEASYADANIANLYRTCGENADGQPVENHVENSYGETEVRYTYGAGEKHDWVEV